MKVLITGINGFIGSYLGELCVQKGVDVVGWMRPGASKKDLSTIKDKISIVDCDIRDGNEVKANLRELCPDWIFHMAAQSHVGKSWQSPGSTIETNITGQLNLLEGIRSLNLSKSRIQIACSSEEYGLINSEDLPVNENVVLKPISPYALTKVAQDVMGEQYNKRYDMNIIRTRAFNQSGPRRSDNFVTSAFAKQVAMIEAKLQEPVVHVGNVEAIRDFTDIRDGVRAFWLLMEKGVTGDVYNLCSGVGYSAQNILDILKKISGADFDVKIDKERMRPIDLPKLVGDNSKLKKATDWSPKISFEESMSDLLDYWRSRIAKEA